MSWCGTHAKIGPSAIIETFANVGRHWENQDFTAQAVFGSGENVAVFGSMSYMSKVMRITKTSPFAI
jgi:hypothetical protein